MENEGNSFVGDGDEKNVPGKNDESAKKQKKGLFVC